MPQFLIKKEEIENGRFILSGQQARHLVKSLRVKPFEKIRLFDGAGRSYLGEITAVDSKAVSGTVISEAAPEENRVKLNLFPALIKADRFELVLQKATELGVDSITPVITGRTVVKPEKEKFAGRRGRWNRIIISAGEQCFRERMPELGEITGFAQAAGKCPSDNLNLIAHEKESAPEIKEIFRAPGKPPAVNLFIGPEGGFTEDEIRLAAESGFRVFRMGKNILRAETASLAASAIILHCIE